MNINTAIQNATLVHLLPEIAQNATTKLSFFGTRSIQVPGYEGFASIDSLAAKVMKLARSSHFEYSLQERAFGETIARNINRIYSDSDKQVAISNCLSQFICYAREFFCNMSMFLGLSSDVSCPRWIWDQNDIYAPSGRHGYNAVFSYYTPRQFFENYGRNPRQGEMRDVFGIRGSNFHDVELAVKVENVPYIPV